MSQSLAVVQPQQVAAVDALKPRSIQEAILIAETLCGSPLLHKDIRSDKSSVFLMLMTAHDLGLSVSQAFRGVHVINGRPSMAADLMVALCLRRRDVCSYFRCQSSTESAATYVTQRVDHPAVEAETFTLDDAKRAKLFEKQDSNWAKYPRNMLRHRAASILARRVYPEIIFGVYTPDEIKDGVIEVEETSPGRFSAPPPPVSTGRDDSVSWVPGNVFADRPSLEASTEAPSMLARIQAAESVPALESLAGALKQAPADQLPALRSAYRERREQILATTATREPGEEG